MLIIVAHVLALALALAFALAISHALALVLALAFALALAHGFPSLAFRHINNAVSHAMTDSRVLCTKPFPPSTHDAAPPELHAPPASSSVRVLLHPLPPASSVRGAQHPAP
ncbi:hypothetical protein N9L19_01430 [bacterium]|nr:hypothetical protein [bacterium]